jgi:preprotein translocase subunit Sec63
MVNFDEIDEARRVMGLGEAAMLKEVKSAYRRLAHRHHPDKHGSATEENDVIMKKLNWAYKLLLKYCTDYKYSFKEEDVARTYPYEERMRKWRDKWFNSI